MDIRSNTLDENFMKERMLQNRGASGLFLAILVGHHYVVIDE